MERWLQGISTNNPSDGDQASMGFCLGAPATNPSDGDGRQRRSRAWTSLRRSAPAEIFVIATGSPPPLPPPMTPCFHRRPLDLRATHSYGDANTPLGSDNSFDAAAPTTRR
ncbi:hypothetical protein TIFTF001_017515 [Ficus carica]|uniref:Uncharacterized protein n=1 Tax=Ficus carica TaxID=3494 RepID=A0AA88A871_FICCA|nr:hypothetical protein TIFTF001_017515 [Ficus carica]